MPDELSGRELDAAIDRQVFGIAIAWEGGKNRSAYPQPPIPVSGSCPRYSESIGAAMQVENRIAELGKQGDYIAALWDVIGADRSVNFWTASNTRAFWLCVHATPEQRCRAALRCLNGSKE